MENETMLFAEKMDWTGDHHVKQTKWSSKVVYLGRGRGMAREMGRPKSVMSVINMCTMRWKRKPIILYDEYAMTVVKRINSVLLAKLSILCKAMKPHVLAVRV